MNDVTAMFIDDLTKDATDIQDWLRNEVGKSTNPGNPSDLTVFKKGDPSLFFSFSVTQTPVERIGYFAVNLTPTFVGITSTLTSGDDLILSFTITS